MASSPCIDVLAGFARMKADFFQRVRKNTELIVTAFDDTQARYYEWEIQRRKAAVDLPAAEYIVLKDPPGPKIGPGGATLVAIRYLHKRNLLKTGQRILLLHAGGFSKRLPHHSLTGKLFAPVPLSFLETRFPPTLLDLKLCLLSDVPAAMGDKGGVFLACGDDIQVFQGLQHAPSPSLVPLETQPCSKGAIVGLAHPATVEVGEGHGIYVFSEEEKASLRKDGEKVAVPHSCTTYLHKVDRMTMLDERAVDEDDSSVWVDSSYYFTLEVAEILERLFNEIEEERGALDCEIDAYGDFLQAASHKPPRGFVERPTHVGNAERSKTIRSLLLERLASVSLLALPLRPSVFIHVGTMKEYLFHYCTDETWASLFLQGQVNEVQQLCSKVAESATVKGPSVMEYCRIEDNCFIGEQSILSSVHLPPGSVLPPSIFLQTVPILAGKETTVYICQVLSTGDDVKATQQAATLFGIPIATALSTMGRDPSLVWEQGEAKTFFNAKLYPAFEKRENAVEWALSAAREMAELHAEVVSDRTVSEQPHRNMIVGWYSLLDCALHRDIESIKCWREVVEKGHI